MVLIFKTKTILSVIKQLNKLKIVNKKSYNMVSTKYYFKRKTKLQPIRQNIRDKNLRLKTI